MYFQLTSAVKRRFIGELRRLWATHPKYRDIVDHIQGKFSFKERPQYGIIVKNSGGSKVDLSADNYLGVVKSYVLLSKVVRKPGISVEWVREDAVAIQQNGGRFPSAPGVYFLDVQSDPNQEGGCQFFVDPLLDVSHEQVALLDPLSAQLAEPPLQGTVRLFEMPSGVLLYEGANYTLTLGPDGKPDGGVALLQPVTGGRWLQADYRYVGVSHGPYPIYEMYANNTAIPGVVLAFGNRVEAGDQVAVIVQKARYPAALEYGGRWELSLDFDVMARDVYSQQEILDQTVMWIWAVLRSQLASQGIEITDVSLGGESEEVYDEGGDDYFYNASFSLTCQTDWSVHVPLDQWLRQVSDLTLDQSREASILSDDDIAAVRGNIQAVESLGLQGIQDPFWSGRKGTFPMIQ
jgi:hypothetical protein